MTRVAIIGAGLAGTVCAYVLKQYGAEPVIYEASDRIAPGASGNDVGLYNPRLSAERTPEADFYTAAFALALRTFPSLENIAWNKCGSLHLMSDEKRTQRFRKTIENWNWPSEHMQILSAAEALRMAGVEVGYEALWLPDSGTVSPRKLCETYAKDIEIHCNTKTESLEHIKADAIILACGYGVKNFINLPLGQVRGQITQVKATQQSQKLKCNLCYGGYFSPAQNGVHALGATFQRWLDHTAILPEDDEANMRDLAEVAPVLAEDLKVCDHRAALRTTAPDHFPVIGHVRDNIYVSTAHGSHGILSSLMGAHILASQITGAPPPLSYPPIEKLLPDRFLV